LKLNGTLQLLVYADDINVFGHTINTIKEMTEALINASKKVGLEVSTEQTKYTSCLLTKMHKYDDMKTENGSSKIFKYFETAVANENCIHAQIKSISNWGNSC
jgi:hypothetical protein